MYGTVSAYYLTIKILSQMLTVILDTAIIERIILIFTNKCQNVIKVNLEIIFCYSWVYEEIKRALVKPHGYECVCVCAGVWFG